MAEIFLSYASEDRDRVKPLAEALQARGYSVWWDRGLAAGDDYARVIGAALTQSKAAIVVWTTHAVASVWVRDEAGRARDAGKLIPVMLDPVDIPLGFGAIHTEDFTRWNGAADAPQMQLLDEAVKARLEGRSVDSDAVAEKRKKTMRRIRLVSILTVAAAVVGIAAGVSTLWRNHEEANAPPSAPQDVASQLLQLVAEGRITPEQAIELAKILEDRTFAGTSAEPAAAGAVETRSLEAIATSATVDDSEFSALARSVYRQSAEALMAVADPAIRQAVLDLSRPASRAAALQSLRTMAEAGGEHARHLWRIVGAVGLATSDPAATEALENARRLDPSDFAVWRLLGYAYQGQERPVDAEGAALVGAGLAAQEAQAPEQAAERLEQALPNLTDPRDRAFVQSELGDVALEQGDARLAADRFREALLNPVEEILDDPAAAERIQDVRQRYALALDGSGRPREACVQLRSILREGGDVSDAPPQLLERCALPRPIEPAPDAVQAPSTERQTPALSPAEGVETERMRTRPPG